MSPRSLRLVAVGTVAAAIGIGLYVHGGTPSPGTPQPLAGSGDQPQHHGKRSPAASPPGLPLASPAGGANAPANPADSPQDFLPGLLQRLNAETGDVAAKQHSLLDELSAALRDHLEQALSNATRHR